MPEVIDDHLISGDDIEGDSSSPDEDALDDLTEHFTLEMLDNQIDSCATQTSLMRNLRTLKGERYRRVVDPLFQNGLPTTYYSVTKALNDVKFPATLIPKCENNCVVYINDRVDLSACPECDAPRYRRTFRNATQVENSVYHYYSLRERIKRAYSHPVLSKLLSTYLDNHENEAIANGNTEFSDIHDGNVWDELKNEDPKFQSPYTIGIGGCSDPVGLTDNQDIIPVIFKCFNYPPWFRTRRGIMWLTVLVPPPKDSTYSYNLDTLLEPLYDELVELYETPLHCFNAHTASTVYFTTCNTTIVHHPFDNTTHRHSTITHHLCIKVEVPVCLLSMVNDTRAFPKLCLTTQAPATNNGINN
jgi:hypothetical protein